MSFYNSAQFDAKLVVAQICATFFLSTLSLSALSWTVHELFGTPMLLRDLYDYNAVNWENVQGVALSTAMVLNGLAVGLILSMVVERAKKCLDFAVTLFFLHFLMCWYYAGVPTLLLWWGVNVASTVLSAVSGEWLCMRRELREISVSDFIARSSPAPVRQPSSASAAGGVASGMAQPVRRPSQRPVSPGPMGEDHV